MIQSLTTDSQTTDVGQLLDKPKNGFAIEALVVEYDLSYLEATTRWMEENSIPEGQYGRFIPQTIIDKIMSEAIDDRLLRPSVAKLQKTTSLDFLL